MNSSGKRNEISMQEWKIECRSLINLLETSSGYYQVIGRFQRKFYSQTINFFSYQINICKGFNFNKPGHFCMLQKVMVTN